MKLNDPETWPETTETIEIDHHPQLGEVKVGRVAQSMFSLLVAIGTPAQSPKPRGKSPGWAKGNTRTKPPRYPIAKKRVTRPKKVSKVAA